MSFDNGGETNAERTGSAGMQTPPRTRRDPEYFPGKENIKVKNQMTVAQLARATVGLALIGAFIGITAIALGIGVHALVDLFNWGWGLIK